MKVNSICVLKTEKDIDYKFVLYENETVDIFRANELLGTFDFSDLEFQFEHPGLSENKTIKSIIDELPTASSVISVFGDDL
ncbi:hypothetical protein EP073_01015 [Geovibrio thiophilus]|uniref:Uncharacterized protein n=1 Tax=Geovibrio thiophilus TaxID=139438 RepID=A0A410JV01_9BACT|nr:hypothetical protein [Geovibrio thiophilus]QAR32030.1 hypothetical protein EP073_01015 [Geovibrio thiophilus]